MSFDPDGHGNMEVSRARGVKKVTVAESIREDGTLITQVNCSFVVHHASWCEMTKDTLAELLNDQLGAEYVDPCHVDTFKIIEANND
jgi:hypothetical protein